MLDCCLYYWIGGAVLVTAISAIAFSRIFSRTSRPDLCGKHVLVTGGSSGIGLSVAMEVVRMGAHVTLVARDPDKLEDARKKVQAIGGPNMRKVNIMPFDVCGDGVDKLVVDAETLLGPIFMLVNCAGYSTPARFEDLSMKEVKRMMDVNFIGTFAVTQSVVRRMKQRENNNQQRAGIVVLTSSQGGLIGVYGFTAYAAAKAALIKFGEALHMEVAPQAVSVTVCVPPDTDTPGFVTENVSKPTETRIISESAGLFSSDAVAKSLVKDALSGRFYSTVGVEGFMIVTLCAGMGPITHFVDFCAQVFLSGIFRIVSLFILLNFRRIVQTEHTKRCNSKRLQ